MDPKIPSEPPENQSENHPPPPEPPEIQQQNHLLAPESPENQPESHPQPPINPNSNTSFSHDHQESQLQSRTTENFRAKLMEYAQVTRMPPDQKLLLEQGFNDFFPNDLSVPNHPPYRRMIHRAIEELNQEGGSNEEAISIHIREKYNDLPWAHATLLRHHLGKLCETGDLVVMNDKCYMLNHGNLIFNPRPSLTPIDIPIDSSSCSPSPCSSSTTSYSPSPKIRQRKWTRKRKYGKKRGTPRKKLKSEEEFEDTEEEEESEETEAESEETEAESEETEAEEFEETDEEEFVSTEEEGEVTQVENQVIEDHNRRQTRRSGGRCLPPKKYESEEKSQSEEEQMGLTGVRNQVMRKPGRGRGRPRTKFGIETKIRPGEAQKEVTEAQNQVAEDQKRLKQGRGRGRPRGRPCRQNEIKEEIQPSELIEAQNQVAEDRKRLKQGMGQCRPRGRPRGRPCRQNKIKEEIQPSKLIEVIEAQYNVIEDQIEVIEKQNQPKEEKEDSFEEQNQLKGVKLDVIEEQSQVPKQQDEVFDKQSHSEKENAVITSEPLTQGEVFEYQNEQKKQERGVNEEQIQPELQNDVMEGKNKPQEQKLEGILEQDKSHQQYMVIAELGQQQEQLEDQEEVSERQHNVVMIRSEAQVQVGVIEELNGIQKQLKGACVERNSPEQQNDVIREMNPSQGEHIEVIKDQSQPGQIQRGEIVEQDQRLEQEIEVAGGQGQHVEQESGLIKGKNPLEEVSNMVERMVLQSFDDGENILGKVSPIFPCKSPRLVTEEEIRKSLKKEREQQMKSPLEEGELFDASNWTQHPERSPELKKMEKLSWIPDQLPQQGTEDESNPCQFHFQTPRPETDADITMKEMVPLQILHEEQQSECIGKGGVPNLELVTTMAESSSLAMYQHGDGPDGPQQSEMLVVERLPETTTSTGLFHSEYEHFSHLQQLEQPKHQGCGKPHRPTPYTDENTESSQMQ